VRHNEGQGKVQHAPDIVRASTTEPISALRSTIGSLWSAGCAWPRDRLNPDAASRSVVDFDPRLVADAAECLSLGLQTRRARPKSFLRRPPRARKRPSEPSCYRCIWRKMRLCARSPQPGCRQSIRVVDFDPRLVADAAECLSLGLQTRRARPKSFLRRPPRAQAPRLEESSADAWHARITCLRRHAGIHEVRPGAHAISRRSARLKPSSLLFQKKTDAGIYGPAAS
jgi:hypothetical protein